MTEEKFDEGEKIQEAEVEKKEESSAEDQQDTQTLEKKGKMDLYIEFGLIFILGVLIGIAVKTEASKKITIGFDDYQMKLFSQDYNINKMQPEVTKKAMEAAQAQKEQVDLQEGASLESNNSNNNQ